MSSYATPVEAKATIGGDIGKDPIKPILTTTGRENHKSDDMIDEFDEKEVKIRLTKTNE